MDGSQTLIDIDNRNIWIPAILGPYVISRLYPLSLSHPHPVPYCLVPLPCPTLVLLSCSLLICFYFLYIGEYSMLPHCSGHIIWIWIRRDEFQEEQQPLMKVNANQHRQPQRLDSIFCQFLKKVFIYPTIPPLRPISTLPLPLLRSPRATLHAQFSPF